MRRRFVLLPALIAALAPIVPAAAPAAITAPAGVGVSTVTSAIPFATNIAFDPAGGMWVTSGAGGPQPSDGVWYLKRGAARPVHVIRGLNTALGLTWLGGRLYVASTRTAKLGQVTVSSGFDGTTFATTRRLLSHLPIGRHSVDTIVPDPAGRRLYLGVGSEFDNRPSTRTLAGTVVSFTPTGHDVRIEAKGLRNPYGLAFIPGTDRLLVTDNGRDDLGAFKPPDTLDLVPTASAAPDFGFPACYAGHPASASCAGVRAPLARFGAHASSDGLAIAPDWAGQGLTAFVAENGSSFAENPTGNDVIMVRLHRRPDGGYDASKRRFATGFARHDPLGATIGPDGALYVTRFSSGGVVRFTAPR